MEKKAFFAGSFDPITNGHLDVIRASLIAFDRLIIGIGVSAGKTPLFDFDERSELLRASIKAQMPERAQNVQIVAFSNLLVETAKEYGAQIIVRGVRNSTDLDYEMNMIGMNQAMAPDIQTVLIPASSHVRPITATLVRQIAKMGGDVTPFVPDNVAQALAKKFN